MKTRIKVPDHITEPDSIRKYLLSRGECLTSSNLFDQMKKLKNKCEVVFVRMENGNSFGWGVGRHR